LLNGIKHNIPSTFVGEGDIIQLRDKLKVSPLYNSIATQKNLAMASWLKVDSNKLQIEVLRHPNVDEIAVPVDLLKVVEFYARA